MIYRFKTFCLDTANFELRSGEDLIAVEPQVFSILLYLIEHRERVVGKDELIEAVWSGRAVSDGSLNTRINAARRAVGDSGSMQSVIKTFTRRGFRFMAEVTESPADDTDSSANLVRSDKPSVAVLPFENMSDDPGQECFADGISEDLLTELSRNDELVVIGRHSSFAFKGSRASLRQIGRELGAEYVVEGSVRKSGNRVRITAQLISTRSDKHLWSERFDRDLEDVFEIQDAVTRAIAERLAIRLKPESRDRSHIPTNNIQAYELFSKGRALIAPPTRENLHHARRAFERVVDLDPTFSGGYAGLSTVISHEVMFNFSAHRRDDIEQAHKLAAVALQHGDRLGWSHIARALSLLVAGDYSDAAVAASTAVEVQPNDPYSQAYLGHIRMLKGETVDVEEPIKTAMELDPKNVAGMLMNFLALAYVKLGRYDDASAAFQRNIDIGGFCGGPALCMWTIALQCADRAQEAQAKARELLVFDPSVTVESAAMVNLYAKLEDREVFREALLAAGIPEK